MGEGDAVPLAAGSRLSAGACQTSGVQGRQRAFHPRTTPLAWPTSTPLLTRPVLLAFVCLPQKEGDSLAFSGLVSTPDGQKVYQTTRAGSLTGGLYLPRLGLTFGQLLGFLGQLLGQLKLCQTSRAGSSTGGRFASLDRGASLGRPGLHLLTRAMWYTVNPLPALANQQQNSNGPAAAEADAVAIGRDAGEQLKAEAKKDGTVFGERCAAGCWAAAGTVLVSLLFKRVKAKKDGAVFGEAGLCLHCVGVASLSPGRSRL